ncbi:HAD-like domain-containing protein [Thelephora terrestris]|uniref:Haloacid dehalogenase-like hydrolase domain-containing protein 2 n=1 Tax=Thelephora terrestris TaxID=56493 RepID=A0A9P6LBQ5_9AGAM|nr:HAD-like domain-containing protein [Thelephora terrestris]
MSSQPIRALLIDLSGTLHVESTPLPGAIQALQRLRASGIPFRFCSNTSKESTSSLCQKLRRIGFDIPPGNQHREVWTSVGAVRQLLKDRGLKTPYFLLSDSAKEECTPESFDPTQDKGYDSVVVGLSPPHFNYDVLTTAFRILKREAPYASAGSPPLIATHKAKYISTSSNQLSLGPGPFVSALESAADVQAIVVGKPTRTFFELVISSLELSDNPEMTGKIAVVGDDVEADLGGGAVELGLWRVLVKTGKYRPGDESKTDNPPDEVVDSFAAFVDRLIATHHDVV